MRMRGMIGAMIRIASGLVLALAIGAATSAFGQLPVARLDAIFPVGGNPGKSVEATIAGIDLDDVGQLQFSHPGITAVPKMADPGPFDTGPQPVENRFVITVKPEVPPATYAVRCLGKYGLSNARTFVVHAGESTLEVEPNNDSREAGEVKLPAVIDGQFAAAADQDWYRFTGAAGQRLRIDGFSRRVDSRAELQLTLFSTDGRIVAESRPARSGDGEIQVTLPAAGEYALRVRDVLHGGGTDFAYRITIDSRPTVEFIFPPAGLPGSNDEYTVYGFHLPGGQPGPLTVDGRPLEQLVTRIAIPADITGRTQFSERLEAHQFALDGIEFRVNSPQGVSNPVLVTVATGPAVREQADNNTAATAQKLTPPCEVVGQFYPQRDTDWYTFDAKAGELLWIEVISQRLGLPTDPTLVIQRVSKNEQGMEQITPIATVDDVDLRHGGREFDQRSYDPAYKFTAPADGTYRILIREGYSQLHNDPRLVYRLAVHAPQPDFRLVAIPIDTSGAVLLRKGGREAVRVVAARYDGFDGEITVSAGGLPAGVTASEVTIGPAAFFTTLILSADANAAPASSALQITGKATAQGKALVRTARAGMSLDPLPFNQPNAEQPSTRARIADLLPITVSGAETARLSMTAGDGKVIETARGGVIKIPYAVTRQDGAAGTITGFPIGLPPNVGLPQVAVGTNNAGDFELRLQANTPPGTYSFYLAGSVQGVNYARNPEGAAKAKERQDQSTKLLAEIQQKATQAQTVAQQMTTALTTATAEVTTATQAKTTADQGVTTANTALKAATDAQAAAAKDSAAAPNDAALKEKAVAAQKTLDDATKKAKDAVEAAKVAETKLTEATTKQKTAAEAKQKADKEQQAAQQLLTLAQQEKQRIDQRAQAMQQQATLRGFNTNIPSTPVTIRIAEHPLKLSGSPEKASVKQGQMLEIPFKVERLYGFTGDVTMQLVPPTGVAGVQAANVALPGNQTDGKLVLMCQANATPGNHATLLRLSMNFNGQALSLDRPLALTVEKVEPVAAK